MSKNGTRTFEYVYVGMYVTVLNVNIRWIERQFPSDSQLVCPST